MWWCLCDCGTEKDVSSSDLLEGHSKSCGCLRSDLQSEKLKRYNTYDLSGEYGIGYTSKGEPFYFDLEDYNKIKDYCWFINLYGYVTAKKIDGNDGHVLFHRLLFPDSEQVDHIHGRETRNDNRKSNLRPVNNSKNQMNKWLQKNNKSGYPGVNWHSRDQIWEVHISVNKKQIYLGRYENYEDAVRVKQEAEEKYFGNYSYKNSQNM